MSILVWHFIDMYCCVLTFVDSDVICYLMKMARQKKPVNLALAPEILEGVDAWIKAQEMPVTKTWVFEKALSEFLERRSGEKKD